MERRTDASRCPRGAQLSVADACQCPIDAFCDLLNAHRDRAAAGEDQDATRADAAHGRRSARSRSSSLTGNCRRPIPTHAFDDLASEGYWRPFDRRPAVISPFDTWNADFGITFNPNISSGPTPVNGYSSPQLDISGGYGPFVFIYDAINHILRIGDDCGRCKQRWSCSGS